MAGGRESWLALTDSIVELLQFEHKIPNVSQVWLKRHMELSGVKLQEKTVYMHNFILFILNWHTTPRYPKFLLHAQKKQVFLFN